MGCRAAGKEETETRLSERSETRHVRFLRACNLQERAIWRERPRPRSRKNDTVEPGRVSGRSGVADNLGAARRGAVAAVRGTAAERVAAPVPAPYHAVRPRRRPPRITRGRRAVIRRAEPVPAPLPHVPCHVIESVALRRKHPNGARVRISPVVVSRVVAAVDFGHAGTNGGPRLLQNRNRLCCIIEICFIANQQIISLQNSKIWAMLLP